MRMGEHKQRTCEDCRYYYERQAGDSTDPMASVIAGYDPHAIQGLCCWDVKDSETFAARPACRRFIEREG